MLAQAAGQLASNLDEVEHAHGVTDDDKSLFYKTPGLWQQKRKLWLSTEVVLESFCETFMKSSCSNKQVRIF